jgi:hypothetical protein
MKTDTALTIKPNDPCDPDHTFEVFHLDVRCGSFATGSSQQQVRPRPLCRRKQTSRSMYRRSAKRTWPGSFDHLVGGGEKTSPAFLGRSIEDFIFDDDVGFRLGSLSVEALGRDSSNCDAREHYHYVSKFRSHGNPPLVHNSTVVWHRATVP